jgi:hypothetical protein
VNGEASNRCQLLLREPCGFAEPFQLRAERSRIANFKTCDFTALTVRQLYECCTGSVGGALGSAACKIGPSESWRGLDDCCGVLNEQTGVSICPRITAELR